MFVMNSNSSSNFSKQKADDLLKQVFHHDKFKSELQEKAVSAVLRGSSV